MSEVRLAAEQRTEFGKGAARRTRRAGKIPAVLYGHGIDPKHIALPALEFARVVREQGANAVLSLELGNGSGSQLALTKTVTVHPIRNYIEHVDLLMIRRGEKVSVEVPVTIVGAAAPGSLVYQELSTLLVEADVLSIPEQFEVSVEGAGIGTQLLAGQVSLPGGVTLGTDEEALVANVVAAPTEEDMEAEIDVEGAGVEEDAPETEAGEVTEAAGAKAGEPSSEEGGSADQS